MPNIIHRHTKIVVTFGPAGNTCTKQSGFLFQMVDLKAHGPLIPKARHLAKKLLERQREDPQKKEQATYLLKLYQRDGETAGRRVFADWMKRMPDIIRRRHTKIVATLGPASNTYKKIEELFWNGADVFRLNYSHITPTGYGSYRAYVDWIRTIERENERPISIMADLQGPKLRIGRFRDGKISLNRGMRLRFDPHPDLGDETRVPLPYPEIFPS